MKIFITLLLSLNLFAFDCRIPETNAILEDIPYSQQRSYIAQQNREIYELLQYNTCLLGYILMDLKLKGEPYENKN